MSRPDPAEPPPRKPPAIDVASLYAAHADTVAAWASALGGPSIEPADVVQEVFIVVHRRLSTFRGDSALTTWLYSITRNVVRNRRRRERWKRLWGGNVADLENELVAPGPTPIEELERRRAEVTVYRALDRLGDRYREIFVLFEIEGLAGEEIAKLTGTKLSTVWVRLHRARQKFLAALEEER